jgi:predicted transcriptional regulator
MTNININIKETVHEFLKSKTQPMTSADISKVIGFDTSAISKALYSLSEKDRLLTKSKCPETGKNRYCIKQKPTEPMTQDEDDAITYALDNDLKLEFALQKLETTINKPALIIENSVQKIDVLNRLSAILDDSISEVLTDIVKDIKTITDSSCY